MAVTAGISDWMRRIVGFAGLRRDRGERRLKLLETLQLGGRRQLLLVVCDGRRVVVGIGGDSVQSIVQLSEKIESGRAEVALPCTAILDEGEPGAFRHSSGQDLRCN
jgi:flagellar biogenesis protein FliO